LLLTVCYIKTDTSLIYSMKHSLTLLFVRGDYRYAELSYEMYMIYLPCFSKLNNKRHNNPREHLSHHSTRIRMEKYHLPTFTNMNGVIHLRRQT